MEDKEIVHRIKNGDQAAFETLILKYHNPLLMYLEVTLKDRQKAEDIVQETFLRFIESLRKGKVLERIEPWLYKVATNLCKDYWKSLSYKLEREDLSNIPEPKDKSLSISEIYEQKERQKEILNILGDLSPTQRQIIILRFYQELKIAEIADILEIPIGTVKSNLFYTLKKLRKKLVYNSPNEKLKEG